MGGIRTPFARSHTAYAGADNQELLTASLRALVERYELQGQRLGDVIAGAVIKHPKDYNLTRESLLSTGLDPQTPGLDLQRACGTSLEAAILVANKIALGQIDAGIAAGVDDLAIRRWSIRDRSSSGCCAAPAAAASGSASSPGWGCDRAI